MRIGGGAQHGQHACEALAAELVIREHGVCGQGQAQVAEQRLRHKVRIECVHAVKGGGGLVSVRRVARHLHGGLERGQHGAGVVARRVARRQGADGVARTPFSALGAVVSMALVSTRSASLAASGSESVSEKSWRSVATAEVEFEPMAVAFQPL